MRAMVLEKPGFPLQLVDREKPAPAEQEILVRVATCGVCRTDLHVLDGELEQTEYPIIPGHQVVGIIETLGADVAGFEIGERVGDLRAQQFALALGAVWAGSSEQSPDRELDAVIIFAPVGELVPRALGLVRPGGKVVCAGIHMTDIPSFPYGLLWHERSIRSVANLTRSDGIEFLSLAEDVAIETEVHAYPLEQANQALEDLKRGNFTGAAVVQIS